MPDKKLKESKGQFLRVIIIWTVIFVCLYIGIQFIQGEKYKEVSFTKFWEYIETNGIESVTFEGQEITAKLKGTEEIFIKTRLPFEDSELPKELINRNYVFFRYKPSLILSLVFLQQ